MVLRKKITNILGTQPEDAFVFSMCNCITLRLPMIYTAHHMTMDLFLKKVEPGIRIPVPHIDVWPPDNIKIYKIPKKITIFLFSTFNENYLQNYVCDDGIRYTIGRGQVERRILAHLKGAMKPVPFLSTSEYCEQLKQVGEKVDRIWDHPAKIIVKYDYARLHNPKILAHFFKYDQVIEDATGWPVVQMNDPDPIFENPNLTGNKMWCHYSSKQRLEMFGRILEFSKKPNQ